MIPNFNEMTVKDLKEYAKENSIDLQGAKSKNDIVARLEEVTNNNTNIEEDNQMEENMNVNEEIVTGGEGQENLPETTGEVKAEKKVYHLDDGTECSRSAYIRQEFGKDRSRASIKEELGVAYYVIYAATANMYNAAHPEGAATVAGKGSVLVPKVNAEFKYVNAEGTVVETAEEAVQVPRADLMRELAEAGKTRAEIKDYFGVPYATVYAATKDSLEGEGRGNKKLIHPVTQVEVNRADYIRELFAAGKSRRDIAKELTILTGDLVDYSTVWAATKPEKADDEVKADETVVPEDVTENNDENIEQ